MLIELVTTFESINFVAGSLQLGPVFISLQIRTFELFFEFIKLSLPDFSAVVAFTFFSFVFQAANTARGLNLGTLLLKVQLEVFDILVLVL